MNAAPSASSLLEKAFKVIIKFSLFIVLDNYIYNASLEFYLQCVYTCVRSITIIVGYGGDIRVSGLGYKHLRDWTAVQAESNLFGVATSYVCDHHSLSIM